MSAYSPKDSEWLTRKQLIDPKLKAAGWRIVPFDPAKPLASYSRCAVEEFPTDNGPADYAPRQPAQCLILWHLKYRTSKIPATLLFSKRH